MRTLVVYDSLHGNTEMIARAIGSAISGEVEVRRVTEVIRTGPTDAVRPACRRLPDSGR